MGRADPNSEVTTKVSPDSCNPQATYPGTRYGKGGTAPGQSDASTETIISSSSAGK